jgi:hypothetical protein
MPDIPVVYWKFRDTATKYPGEANPIFDEVSDEFWPRFLVWLANDTDDPSVERFRAKMRSIRRDPGQSWGPAAVCTKCGGLLKGHP